MPEAKLKRSNDRMIAGVCGGLAEWVGWKADRVRVAYVILSILFVSARAGLRAWLWGRDVRTVDEVIDSPMVSDPLHRLDCCVISDGGGALVIARPEIAKSLKRPLVKVIGTAGSTRYSYRDHVEIKPGLVHSQTYTAYAGSVMNEPSKGTSDKHKK